MQETKVRSLGREDALEEGMATHSSTLAWRIPMDRGAWQATVHRVAESWTQMKRQARSHMYLSKWLREALNSGSSDYKLNPEVIDLSIDYRSEKAMTTHSSTLAWKIPWTEEPGGLQSMGSRRVGHD